MIVFTFGIPADDKVIDFPHFLSVIIYHGSVYDLACPKTLLGSDRLGGRNRQREEKQNNCGNRNCGPKTFRLLFFGKTQSYLLSGWFQNI